MRASIASRWPSRAAGATLWHGFPLDIANHAVAIHGGRNVADEYFMNNREANFIDMDLLSTGAVVAAELMQLMRGNVFSSMYRHGLQPDRRTIEWTVTDADGQCSSTTTEPEGDPSLRFKRWLQSLFVDERLL